MRIVFAQRYVHRIPHPTFVTIAKRPSWKSAGRLKLVEVICPTAQAENFWQRRWTEVKGARQKFTDLPDGQINAVAKSGSQGWIASDDPLRSAEMAKLLTGELRPLS
jgi:hypothetical protein